MLDGELVGLPSSEVNVESDGLTILICEVDIEYFTGEIIFGKVTSSPSDTLYSDFSLPDPADCCLKKCCCKYSSLYISNP